MTSAPVQMVLDKLPSAKPAGHGKWTAFCPVHEADGNGHKPSLSIGQGDDGRALLDCKAGCATGDVVQALGLTMADLFPDCPKANAPRAATRRIVKTYDYLDEIGTLVYQSVRYDPKDFRQRRPDGNGGWVWNLNGVPRILYRLPELLAANPAAWVFVNEGEKDADNVAALGLVATTNPGGAGKWKHLADDSALHGRRVCIVADKDDKGRKHAKDVAARLCGKAADVRIVELPDVAGATVKDVSNWIEAQDAQGPEDLATALVALADAAPSFDPATVPEPPDGNGEAGSPVLVCLANVKAVPVNWLWPNRIPLGRITLLVGRPGEGKSFLATDLAARVTTGSPWPDGSACPAGTVIMISVEDDPGDTIRPRLDAHHADANKVYLLRAVRHAGKDGKPFEVMFTLRDLDALETALKTHPDCKAVVIDPIGSFIGGTTDAHRDNEVRAVLAPVARLAEKHGAAVLVIAHRRKSGGDYADDLALGSRAFTGIARAVWHLSRDPDNKQRRLLLPGKNNLAPESDGLAFSIAGDPPALVWERDPVKMNADDGLAVEAAEGESGGARQEAVAWLQDVLAQGPVKATDVKDRAEADGIKPRTLDRAKATLKVEATRQGFGGPWVWALPARSAPSSPEERQG